MPYCSSITVISNYGYTRNLLALVQLDIISITTYKRLFFLGCLHDISLLYIITRECLTYVSNNLLLL